MGDSTVQALTLRLGTQAERQTQMRLERVVAELTPQRAVSQLAVFMLDGYLVRYRRAGWDKKRTRKKRVEGHEIKAGVSYLQEQAPRIEGGRGVLNEKGEVCWQGEGAEPGRDYIGRRGKQPMGRTPARCVAVVLSKCALMGNSP